VKLPTLGVRVHGGMPPRTCIEIAEAVEKNGLASIWFAENPFNRGVLPTVGATVAATRRIKVGIGVFNPYNRHPTLMAMEVAALDDLAGGRAAIGIGSGIGDRVTRMGLSYEKPLAAVRDAITILRGMLKGESVTYQGTVFSVTNAKLEFTPPRLDMPIYMAATGDQALRLCGQIADGLMISNMSPPGYTVRAQQLLAEGAAKAQRPAPSTIIQYVPCVVRRDRAEARAVVKGTVGEMLSAYWTMSERWPAIRQAMVSESGILESEFIKAIDRVRAGEKAVDVLDDRFVDAYSIAGNADDCLAAIGHYGEIGVTELILTFIGTQPTVDMAYLGESLAKHA
jgi:5,10-methylenetetrahydromethanopterin reductase